MADRMRWKREYGQLGLTALCAAGLFGLLFGMLNLYPVGDGSILTTKTELSTTNQQLTTQNQQLQNENTTINALRLLPALGFVDALSAGSDSMGLLSSQKVGQRTSRRGGVRYAYSQRWDLWARCPRGLIAWDSYPREK